MSSGLSGFCSRDIITTSVEWSLPLANSPEVVATRKIFGAVSGPLHPGHYQMLSVYCMSTATWVYMKLNLRFTEENLPEVEWQTYSLEREGREEVCAEDSLKKL